MSIQKTVRLSCLKKLSVLEMVMPISASLICHGISPDRHGQYLAVLPPRGLNRKPLNSYRGSKGEHCKIETLHPYIVQRARQAAAPMPVGGVTAGIFGILGWCLFLHSLLGCRVLDKTFAPVFLQGKQSYRRQRPGLLRE